MKTNEFKKLMEQRGLSVFERESSLEVIYPSNGSTLVEISTNKRFWINTDFNRKFRNEEILEDVLIYATKLACTPLEDREEEKKYIYELPVKNLIREKSYLLRYSDTEVRFDASSKSHVLRSPTYHFTDAEVESYSEDIQALFKACEKEFVE